MNENNRVLDPLRKQLFGAFECKEETIYHYADQAGLLGIITEKALRAHSIRYMNDLTEGKVARELWRKVMDASPEARDFWGQFRNSLPLECFCTSFSLESDLLSQWRGYAAEGAGFALGFDPNGFRKDSTICSGRVLYDAAKQLNLVDDTIVNHGQFLATSADKTTGLVEEKTSSAELSPMLVSIAACLVVFECMMKNDAYREEREYRITLASHPNRKRSKIKFCTSIRGLKPYLEIPFEKEHSLKEIIVGPLLPFEDTRQTLQMLLTCEGYGTVEIRPSKIPHRQ